ncbi:MAG: hypothetical protein H0W25_21190 [Acidimicrobiia bacterium]|nr:hypothetical protein [Acidimicrobiia bacterium]
MTNPDLAAQLRNPSRPTLYFGGDEDGYWTGLLEEALTAAGFPPQDSINEEISDTIVQAFGGTLPERFDYTTCRAARAFQRQQGLHDDGVVSDVTWDSLAWVVGDGEDEQAAASMPQPDEQEAQYAGERAERLALVITEDDIRFEQWLRAFNGYLGGSDGPFHPGELETFQWAQDDPDIRAAMEALLEEDQDNQLGMYATGPHGDGVTETRRENRVRERRELFLRGAKALAGSPLGAMAWGAAKAAGADDAQALSAAEMGNTITDMVGTHQEAAGFEHPQSVADDPNIAAQRANE